MGYNLTGIAINKNLEQNIDILADALNIRLIKQGEISFEEASANHTRKEDFFVYFTDNGTLIFLHDTYIMKKLSIPESITYSFLYGEGYGDYYFYYDDDTKNIIREITFMQPSNLNYGDYEGEGFHREVSRNNLENIPETVWNLIGDVIGKPFSSIDLEEKALHYKISARRLG